MKFERFMQVVRRFELEDGFADALYLEAIRKLEEVRKDYQKLNEIIARRIIRPFLANWGRMGRNVERQDFDWQLLVEVIKNQRGNLDKLRRETILDVRLGEVASIIKAVYDGMKVRHLGPTGISKVLHLLNPELFVMWDLDIRRKINDKSFSASSRGYFDFLRWIQSELIEATAGRIIDEIRDEVGGEYIDEKTLAKLADEYCWRTAREK